MLFLAFLTSLVAHASCDDGVQQAMQMCKTETMISKAQAESQAIEKAFRPANGRMSPESCQGFWDGYSDFQSLTRSYIQNCQEKISTARASCKSEVPAAVRDKGNFETIVNSIKTLKRAEQELPKLQALLPPMDKLKGRLADCLRDTPGRIVNTDTDRGNADLAANLSFPNGGRSAGHSPSGGTIVIGSSEHGRDRRVPAASRGAGSGGPFAGQRLRENAASRVPGHDSRFRLQPQKDKLSRRLVDYQLQLRDKQVRVAPLNAHDFVIPTRGRGPASIASHGPLASPHRSLFLIIRERYMAKEKTFSP